jgi:hypothetical protein
MKETLVLLVRLLGKSGLVLIERNAGWVLHKIKEGAAKEENADEHRLP